MKITQAKKGNIVIIRVQGELDAHTSNRLEEKLMSLIDDQEKRFVVDFSQLHYISSAGLRVFMTVARRLKIVKGKIALCALKKHVKEAFDMVGYFTIFSVYPSQEEAINELQ